MISLHRLNGQSIVLNADLIEYVEATPDTVVTLTSGNKLRVLETLDEVQQRVIAYQRAIHEPESPQDGPDTAAAPR
ncbi:flagellar protein [bacterium]|nr:MAG: flagellar protein [bacterium]